MALPRSLQSYSKLGKGDNKWVRHNRQGSSNSKSDGRVYRQTDKCEYNKGPRSSGTADGIKCIRQATTSGVKTRFKPSNRYLGVRKALVHRTQAAKAFCLANNVVLTAGHHFPGPFKFCRVINAAFIQVLWLWFELSVGNVTLTEGLFTAIHAWTLLSSDCKAGGIISVHAIQPCSCRK